MRALILLLAGSWAVIGWAADHRWQGFYDAATLEYWRTQTPPGIEENFREVLWPKLTGAEQRRLGRVQLEFPVENSVHPMNFYANPETRTIFLPVSSTRFFGDVVLAYTWLDAHGYSLEPVTDYLSMLKYQWPGRLRGQSYQPLAVLGVPANARDEPGVQRAFQNAYGTAVVFILGHELGHLYHRHRGYDQLTPEQAQRQETQADEFGLELMRRIGAAPLGLTFFFTTLVHLEPVPGDPDYETRQRERTHPLNGRRLEAITAYVTRHVDSFAGKSPNPAATKRRLGKAAVDLRTLAQLIDDPGLQSLLRQKGQTADPQTLTPRRPGEVRPATAATTGKAALAFDGTFSGRWLDARGTDLAGKLVLHRTGDSVRGNFNFGVGNVQLEGEVVEGAVYYRWRWGTDYFGKGVLKAEEDGAKLTGTWGYTQKSEGGGTWQLTREPAADGARRQLIAEPNSESAR